MRITVERFLRDFREKGLLRFVVGLWEDAIGEENSVNGVRYLREL